MSTVTWLTSQLCEQKLMSINNQFVRIIASKPFVNYITTF